MRTGKICGARAKFASALFLGLLLATSCTSAGHSPTTSSWTSLWRDDFDGPAGSAPSSANWQHDIGTCYPGCLTPRWGTEQIDTATDSTRNVALDGRGNLAITAVNTGGQWTSGRIETRRADFRVPPKGVLRIEARMRMPNVGAADGSGYWSAFWLLGAPFRDGYSGWPEVGEIDIAESVNGRPSTFAAMHCGKLVDGPCGEPKGLGSGERPCPDCQQEFHTYAVEIDHSSRPQEIRWYKDSTQFFAVRANQMDAETWRAATDHGFFVILNLAIGGQFPLAIGGRPNDLTASGRPLLFDYISISSRSG